MDKIKLKPAFTDERGSIWDIVSDETIHHSGYLISKKDIMFFPFFKNYFVY